MPTYCEVVREGKLAKVHEDYHAHHYGFPISDDTLLFERFVLEINQAGLSWTTILNKQENFRKAFQEFEISKIARYKDKDIERLLGDAGIIRNRFKINAAIENAKRVLELQQEHGSFKAWLDTHHPLDILDWQKLFKKTFVFTGYEIVRELLLSTGYIPGAHDEDCPVQERIKKLNPPWQNVKREV
ncbi:MAG: DNA-3-methyladenine glycosylase I [Trueperaceae bacterium]